MEEPPDDEVQPETEPGQEADLLPEARPSLARRRLRIAITLIVIAAFVVVGGLGGSGFFISSPPRNPVPSNGPGPSETAAPQPVSPAPTGRLAVVDANGALSSMAADGGSVVTYSGLDTTFAFPAWSPDGTQLAAIGTSDGGGEINVFQVPAGAGSADAMTIAYQSKDSPPFYLYWSPDGGAIGFLTNEPPSGIGLHQARADGSGIDRLVRHGVPMYWQWVDSTRMFVHSGGPATFDNFLGEVAIDSLDDTPTTPTPGAFRVPALSGDAYLAYASRNVGGSASLVTESRNGTNRHEVTVFGTSAFEFEPGGDTLAFVAATSAHGGPDLPLGPLRAVDPASGTVETLLDGTVVAFFWSPDGSTIAALRLNDPGSTPVVARRSPVGVLARAAAPPTSSGPAGPVNAAGILVKLAFVDVASASVRSEITVRLSDLFITQVLPYFDQYALSHRIWSPDSSSIVLPLDDDQGVSRITIIPADGSDTRAVTAGAMAFWSP